jgi:hypothetical protein
MVNYIKRFVIEPMYINHLNLINYDNKFPDGLQHAHRERDGGGALPWPTSSKGGPKAMKPLQIS